MRENKKFAMIPLPSSPCTVFRGKFVMESGGESYVEEGGGYDTGIPNGVS